MIWSEKLGHEIGTYDSLGALKILPKPCCLLCGITTNEHVDMSLLYSSNGINSSNTCELAAQAANRGVTVLSITDSPISPLANTSQQSFIVQEARVDAFRSLSASLLLSQVLAIGLADSRSDDGFPGNNAFPE